MKYAYVQIFIRILYHLGKNNLQSNDKTFNSNSIFLKTFALDQSGVPYRRRKWSYPVIVSNSSNFPDQEKVNSFSHKKEHKTVLRTLIYCFNYSNFYVIFICAEVLHYKKTILIFNSIFCLNFNLFSLYFPTNTCIFSSHDSFQSFPYTFPVLYKNIVVVLWSEISEMYRLKKGTALYLAGNKIINCIKGFLYCKRENSETREVSN